MKDYKVFRVGIATDKQIRDRSLAIVRGELVPHANDPKIWVRSFSELEALLSDKNRALVAAIKSAPELTVSDLVKITGRQQPAISRALSRMASLGYVTLNKSGKMVVPTIEYDRIEIAA